MAQLPPRQSEIVIESEQEEEDYFDYFYDRPGSEPGALSIDPDALPTEIVLIDYNESQAKRKVKIEPSECTPYLETDSVSWMDVQGLGSEAMLKEIGRIFNLHPLLLEDVVNVPQRPKVDDYNDRLLIIAQMVMPKPNEEGFISEQVSFIVGKCYLLTFQEEPLRDCFDPVRDRIRLNKGRVRQCGSDYLVYVLLDAIVDNFFPVLEDYGERIEDLEDEVVLNPTRRTLEKIYQVRRELLALRRAIWPLRNAINTLVRGSSDLISSDVQIYFRDSYDRAIQILDIVETYRELASGLMDVYMSSISNKMNEVMKLLTVISTIFIPLSFMAGVYGMNFEHIPELGWKWGYWGFWLIVAAIASSLIFFFWRRGWFENFYPVKED
ncbi:magnesium/cobalt transporter CorA [Oscillatoria salina]|uniref:magnesium/cobalt transporter CorA n=1 Tax=Oscillatoria salina TaxID=331517 RepID=UPI0013B88F3B|nr:magnesium/cobalt transporter CorA [Oscillatoria salina]MBZ8181667.1 magnesium/cobalt transporter CorA [Oscillatoria salina IIICB1]NET90172.1 magnesium/cobalt transporter CorA [Kamptonema sp. SIO1D9]